MQRAGTGAAGALTGDEQHELTSTLWRWQSAGGTAWWFVSVDGVAADALSATALVRRLESGRRAGFGSVKVAVRIGGSRWQTSAFPMKEEGWSIPVKAAVRKAEALNEGDPVKITIGF